MSLSKHIDPEELVEQASDHPILSLLERPGGKHAHAYHSGAHAGRYVTEPIPKYKIPEKGTNAEATYQVSNPPFPPSPSQPCFVLNLHTNVSLSRLCGRILERCSFVAAQLRPEPRWQADAQPRLLRPHLDAAGGYQAHDRDHDDQHVRSR